MAKSNQSMYRNFESRLGKNIKPSGQQSLPPQWFLLPLLMQGTGARSVPPEAY